MRRSEVFFYTEQPHHLLSALCIVLKWKSSGCIVGPRPTSAICAEEVKANISPFQFSVHV